MTHDIRADWDTLLRQAKLTGEDYFVSAHTTLKHSGLQYTASDVIALAKVMADDFHSASISVAGQKISEALVGIECGLDSIAENVGMAISDLTVAVGNSRP